MHASAGWRFPRWAGSPVDRAPSFSASPPGVSPSAGWTGPFSGSPTTGRRNWPGPGDLVRPEPRPGSLAASAIENDAAEDPVQVVRAALVLATARAEAGDREGARRAEDAAVAAGSRLRPDGRIASVPALCDALHVSRDVYYDVVRRFAGRRGIGRRTRSGSASDRMLRALANAGDTRFALFRARLESTQEAASRTAPEPLSAE